MMFFIHIQGLTLCVVFQALDMEVLKSEGLQLDLVEQMEKLSLQEGQEAQEPSINEETPPSVFQKETPSTKVTLQSF